jgi:hypothetical protein
MSLQRAPNAYGKEDQDRLRKALDQRDAETRKKQQDVEIAGAERLILPDLITGDRYSVTIQSGVVVLELVA